MKKVLLTSTALVMTAGVAAAEMTMSASAKLTYGNFGTGDYRKGYTAPNAGGFAVNATTGAIAGTAGTYTTGGAATKGTSNIAALNDADLTKGETAYNSGQQLAQMFPWVMEIFATKGIFTGARKLAQRKIDDVLMSSIDDMLTIFL